MMVELIQLSDDISVDLRNRELEMPGLTDHILERLAQVFKVLGRKVAFSPPGQHQGLLAGKTGESYAETFFYRKASKRGAPLRVVSLSARAANIFEGSGLRAAGKYPIITATAAAFVASNPEMIIQEEVARWSEEPSDSSARVAFRSGGNS